MIISWCDYLSAWQFNSLTVSPNDCLTFDSVTTISQVGILSFYFWSFWLFNILRIWQLGLLKYQYFYYFVFNIFYTANVVRPNSFRLKGAAPKMALLKFYFGLNSISVSKKNFWSIGFNLTKPGAYIIKLFVSLL